MEHGRWLLPLEPPMTYISVRSLHKVKSKKKKEKKKKGGRRKRRKRRKIQEKEEESKEK